MGIEVVPYAKEHEAAVHAFNLRMANAPSLFLLPEKAPQAVNEPRIVSATQYLAVDEDKQVRGGVIVMDVPAWINGREVAAANLQSPLSEGIVDPMYSMVGMQLIRWTLRRTPYLYVVGMGSADNPLPRLLKAFGWKVRPAAFLFKMNRVGRCLRELSPLRARPLLRSAAVAASISGAGWMGVRWLQRRRTKTARLETEPLNRWPDWVDAVWERYRAGCSFAMVRDSRTLPLLYDPASGQLRAFALRRGGQPVGWFSLLDAPMSGHRYFGNLRVATLLDCVAPPEEAGAAAAAAWEEARRMGADLVITNQTLDAAVAACRSQGFLERGSNYFIATSKALTEECDAAGGDAAMCVTRRDGDGIVNLQG